MTIPTEDGHYADVPEVEYHADRGSLSVSGAKLLLPPSCPAKFREAMDNPPPPKPHFDFGTLAHALILGKGPEIEILYPEVHGLKADGTVADVPSMTGMWKKAAAAARAKGRLPVSSEDYVAAQAMRDAVMAHPVAGPLFAEGEAEVSLYAADDETGVRLRGRVDWVRQDLLVDLKTTQTANPAELVRRWWQYGYHMQAQWYRSLAVTCGLFDTSPDFIFVAVEKVAPYVVTVIEYDDEALAEGARLNRLAVDTYADCMESGVWPGYSEQTVTLSLPRWALNQSRAEADLADAADIIAELEGITA